MSDTSRMKLVYSVTERNGRTFGDRIGVAFVNSDGSITVKLDALPLSGEMEIRSTLVEQEAWRPGDLVVCHKGQPDEWSGVVLREADKYGHVDVRELIDRAYGACRPETLTATEPRRGDRVRHLDGEINHLVAGLGTVESACSALGELDEQRFEVRWDNGHLGAMLARKLVVILAGRQGLK